MILDDKKIPTQPLRDYQVDLIAQIEDAIAQGHRRIMLQLPTGAGKTRCFADGVHNCLDVKTVSI